YFAIHSLVLGGLVGNFVTLGLDVIIPMGESGTFNLQQELFDVILPGMLPLLLTLGCYGLIKKGWSSIKIILLIFIVGLVGGLLGILA
ncbi:PTS system mannose/fructose/sorbose family transporter subunit IID, partial [Caldifermentibacillus hisashii]|uniref:PTS system mannose/fructose/sorbose family transporter subunit IID n=1 Tax=Caldifermentibacillus hisashii TaxID=996558 RepID=UPI003D1BFEC2